MTLQGKKIILGITGSIAAYKSALLVRQLIQQGAEVRAVMTPAACDFITPLTISTLCKHPVHSDISGDSAWNNHVELGLWGDALVIAPASANTIAKMANGLCDNLLNAVYLASRCPVFVAPAMDLDMWEHPSTQANIHKLESYGNHLLPVGEGELASGLVGKGRMAEPNVIVDFLSNFFAQQAYQPLKDKKILITSGPTIEPIDPVRFISNHSTGKMGAAIAELCAAWGATITFVTGVTHHKPHHPNIRIVPIQTAEDMYQAAVQHFGESHITILAAAVADYTPEEPAQEKIKKKTDVFNLSLKKTKDIAAELGKLKSENQLMVGFALETNNAIEHAQGKLKNKNLDLIVLNTLEDKGAGFGHDTNKITLINNKGELQQHALKSKQDVAKDIVQAIVALL